MFHGIGDIRKALVARLPMSGVARASERNKPESFMNLLVDAHTQEFLGAQTGTGCDEVLHLHALRDVRRRALHRARARRPDPPDRRRAAADDAEAARAAGVVLQTALCDRHEPLVIERRRGGDVVPVAKENYSSLGETAYLLSSPENARRLLQALRRRAEARSTFASVGKPSSFLGV